MSASTLAVAYGRTASGKRDRRKASKSIGAGGDNAATWSRRAQVAEALQISEDIVRAH